MISRAKLMWMAHCRLFKRPTWVTIKEEIGDKKITKQARLNSKYSMDIKFSKTLMVSEVIKKLEVNP